MMKQSIWFRHGMVACLLACPVSFTVSAVDFADFVSGQIPAGWTVENGEYRSPKYSNAVDRIELLYSGEGSSASATVSAFPQQGDATTVATFTAASSGAAFDFPDTADFRSFRVATNGIALASFTAYVSASELDAPSDVTISNNTTGTSFDANWHPVEGATGYRVYVWTNVVAGASVGTTVWQETLPGATNASSTTKMSDVKFASCFENSGWTRSDKAGYPTGENGTIRIGTTGDDGWLQTPPILAAADDMAVRFHAKAVDSKSDGKSIAVERISGETVAFAETATLSAEMQEFVVPLSEWESGDCIRFNSITNGDRRVVIGSVTVVSGYSAGQETPVYIVDGLDVGTATSHSLAGLPSVPVQFAVEAYGRRGVASEKTGAVEIDLANPDQVAVLNACPLSALTSPALTYTQNFDSLAALTASTGDKEWLNGTTLPYWQAYRGNDAVEKIAYNAGTGSSGGLYALATDASSSERALGGITTKSDPLTWGMAFTNDTGQAVTLSSVEYSAQQWGTRNAVSHNLTISYLVTDSLEWMGEMTGAWTEVCSTASDGNNPAVPVMTDVRWEPAGGVVIPSGQILHLKWKVELPASGSAAMMGIDDVRVTFSDSRGMVMRIVDNAH